MAVTSSSWHSLVTTCREAEAVAGGILRAVRAAAPLLAGRAFPAETLSVSIGLACVTSVADTADESDHARSAERLFHAADTALYNTKRSGRGKVTTSSPASADTSLQHGSSRGGERQANQLPQ